jgi:peptidoglycan/LPS O-acetylase OafA/YrhL
MVNRKYFPAIDGLRAIAVLMVLVFHFDLLPAGYGGFTGVDVFYVISGFLITSIIKRQLDTDTFSLAHFYLSRIRRLAPALFTTLLLTLGVGDILLFPSELIDLSKQLLAAQTYVANFYYWKSINYFGLSSSSAFLLHTWSLAIEEQFYLFYPLLLIAFQKYLSRFFWHILFILLALSLGLNIALVSVKPEATFYLLPTRAWELLLGALVVWLRARTHASPHASQFFGIVGIGLVAYGFFGYERSFYFPGYFALFPACGAALIILSVTTQQTHLSAVMANPIAVYLGKISYPLYLVHWPLNAYAIRLMDGALGTPSRYALVALSIALAAAIFHFVEEPIRLSRRLTSEGILCATYFTGLIASFGFCAAIYGLNGLPGRFSPEAIRLASFADDKTGDLPCQFGNRKIGDASFCRIGTTEITPTWLIYGDSHAWAAYPAFDAWLKKRNQAGLFIFRQACPPLLGIHLLHDEKCFAFNSYVMDFLDASPAIANVMLVSTWIQAREAILSNSEAVALVQRESIALFKSQFVETLTHLKSRDKRIIIWEPLPGAKKNVPLSLAKAYPRKVDHALLFTKREYEMTFDYFFEALNDSRFLIEQTVSPSKSLCGSGNCSVTFDNRPLYFDNSHIAASSWEYWVRLLEDSVH